MFDPAAQSRIAHAILVFFLLMGIAIVFITPYGEFGDEQTHLRYANYIRTHGALPPMSFNLHEMTIQESFQPPLYYMVSAVFLLFNPSLIVSIFLLRFLSLILAAVTVWLIWKSALLVFPKNASLAAVAMSVTAFNPEFLYVNCGITNISMMGITCSLMIYTMLLMVIQQSKLQLRSCLMGLAFGAALLSRTFTICLALPAAVAIYLADRTKFIRCCVIFGISALAVCSWWYIRNWINYGDPFAWRLFQHTVGYDWIRKEPFNLFYIAQSLAFMHAYFWAYFGKNTYHAQVPDYAVYLLMLVLGVIGVIEIFRRGALDPDFEPENFQRRAFLLLLFAALVAFGEILALQFRINSPQGRYLFMVIVPFSVAFGAGLAKLLPGQIRAAGSTLIVIFFFGMCVYIMLRYWFPHYAHATFLLQ